jgi:hypothetical protein
LAEVWLKVDCINQKLHEKIVIKPSLGQRRDAGKKHIQYNASIDCRKSFKTVNRLLSFVEEDILYVKMNSTMSLMLVSMKLIFLNFLVESTG